LEKVGADAAGGLSEEFRDVEDPKLSFGPKTGRELGTTDVDPGTEAGRRSGLMIEDGPHRVISQNSHPAGTSSRS
jgi:hypothetical protein